MRIRTEEEAAAKRKKEDNKKAGKRKLRLTGFASSIQSQHQDPHLPITE